jgi:phosphate transport system permease protein
MSYAPSTKPPNDSTKEPAPFELVDNPAKRSSGILRRGFDVTFRCACIAIAFTSVAILVILLVSISAQGYLGLSHDPRSVDEVMRGIPEPSARAGQKPIEKNLFKNLLSFLNNGPSPSSPWDSGILPSIMGTVWLVCVCGLFTIPIGIGTAILLEEFKPRTTVGLWLHGFVQLNISNLAGVPSVVYGLLGLTAFVHMFGLFGSTKDPMFEMGVRYFDQFIALDNKSTILIPVESLKSEPTQLREGMTALTGKGAQAKIRLLQTGAARPTDKNVLAITLRAAARPSRYPEKSWYYIKLPFGYSVLSGGLTLMLVVLPVIIIASQEAIRAVPDSLREGCLGMGATKWQTVWHVTLPAAVPGIMTGAILSMSRAIGEAAPLLIVVAAVVRNGPRNLMDECYALPLQIHEWATNAFGEFQNLAACAIVVLLTLLLTVNSIAIIIRQRFSKPLS